MPCMDRLHQGKMEFHGIFDREHSSRGPRNYFDDDDDDSDKNSKMAENWPYTVSDNEYGPFAIL